MTHKLRLLSVIRAKNTKLLSLLNCYIAFGSSMIIDCIFAIFVSLIVDMVLGGKFAQVDYFVLKALYASTNGDLWTYDNSTGLNYGSKWYFENPLVNPCDDNWVGITCNENCAGDISKQCVVTELNVFNYGLSGTIPLEIGLFNALNGLILDNNSLYGTIPSTLGNISTVSRLSLSRNCISGSIPRVLFLMPNIEEITLSHNYLNKSIPGEVCVGAFAALNTLSLNNNKLTGTLPNCLFYGNSSIEKLNLYTNKLHGDIISSRSGNINMDSILLQLDLSNNHFSGAIPLQLNLWTNLRYFNVSNNFLHGHMVISSNLTQLVVYDISHNSITGTISSDLVNLYSLYELVLSNNCLSGSLPDQSGTLDNPYLYYLLDFSVNMLDGTVPSGFSGLTGLNTLLLSSNNLNGDISQVVTKYQPNLKVNS